MVNTAATEIAPAFFENPETGQVTLFYGSNRPGSQGFDVYASPVGEDGYFGPGVLVPDFSSASAGQTTTSIAYDCGFGHLGEFSQSYWRRYGESPSETLRRSRNSQPPGS